MILQGFTDWKNTISEREGFFRSLESNMMTELGVLDTSGKSKGFTRRTHGSTTELSQVTVRHGGNVGFKQVTLVYPFGFNSSSPWPHF